MRRTMNRATRIVVATAVVLLAAPGLRAAPAEAKPVSPVHWLKPDGFDPGKPKLGLPELKGVEHTVVYSPKHSGACLGQGGNGKYESVFHGTYNHRVVRVLLDNAIILAWANHAVIEAGYGERSLGRLGLFNEDFSKIDWGGPDSVVEFSPPAVPVDVRKEAHDPELVREVRGLANLHVINNKLYVETRFHLHHGFSDLVRFGGRGFGDAPPPAANFSHAKDDAKGFIYMTRVTTDCRMWRRWKVDGHRLVPDTSMYRQGTMPEEIEVAEGLVKRIVAIQEPYCSALPLADAPADFIEDVTRGKRVSFDYPGRKWDSAKARVATVDDSNGLCHFTQFQRPDGKWVSIRDNLKRAGTYYAALKDGLDDYYPPGIKSNLPGDNQPVAGELPNGWVWFAGRPGRGNDIYLTVSEDGLRFTQTWSLLTYRGARDVPEGYRKLGMGYPRADRIGDTIWIVYSLSKCKVGVTSISIPSLMAQYRQRQRARYRDQTPADIPSEAQVPVAGAAWTVPHLGMTFVPLKPGTFTMGSGKGIEAPAHEVSISKPFWMGKYEVTQAEYMKVVKQNRSPWKGARLPVHHVSWDDVAGFCRALTAIEREAGQLPEGYVYRLPTEAEWEYACRAGTTGDYAGDLDELGWYAKNSGGKPHPVGSKKANPWGLHDMHGNVAEWCFDGSRRYAAERVTDPVGPLDVENRPGRGGDFRNKGAVEKWANRCRATFRHGSSRTRRAEFLGFRVVLAPPVSAPSDSS